MGALLNAVLWMYLRASTGFNATSGERCASQSFLGQCALWVSGWLLLLLTLNGDLSAQVSDRPAASPAASPTAIGAAETTNQPNVDGEPVSPVVRAIEILRDECVSCHRSGKSKGGLILTGEARLHAGGESGSVVVAGKPGDSLLLSVLSADGDPHMPPKKQLNVADLDAIRDWIAMGAPWDPTVMDKPPRVTPVALSPAPATVEPVLAMAYSPDGLRLALARGGKIELRDASQPKYPVQFTMPAHTDAVIALAWSVDGKALVTGGFRRVGFWDASTGAPAGEWTAGAVGAVTAIAFAPSGDRLWVADSMASRGGFVHELEAHSKSCARTWKAHDDSVFAIAVSADGQWIATGGADRTAKRWNAVTSMLESTYEGHTNHVLAVTFDPLTPRLATAGADRELKVWDRDSREQDAVLGDRRQVFPCLTWTHDGSRLVGVTDKGNGSIFSAIQKHSGAQTTETSKLLRLEKVDAALQCVSAKPDGSEVAAGSSEGRLFIWNGSTGKRMEIE